MKRAVLLALVALAVTTPATEAWWSGPASPRVERKSLAFAKAFWAKPTLCGSARIEYGGSTDQVMAQTSLGTCTIQFSSGGELWSWDTALYCSAMVHEYGHLLGYGHSDDPWHPMYGKRQRVLRTCQRFAKSLRRLRRR